MLCFHVLFPLLATSFWILVLLAMSVPSLFVMPFKNVQGVSFSQVRFCEVADVRPVQIFSVLIERSWDDQTLVGLLLFLHARLCRLQL